MGKVDYRTLTRQQRDAYQQEFLQTFKRLGLEDQGQELLLDMITESEITMFARRLLIARRLIVGQPISEIAGELRVSHHTIRVVDHWLEGKFDAYRKVLAPFLRERLKNVDRCGKDEGRWDMLAGQPSTLQWVERRYPKRSSLFEVLMRYPRVYPRPKRSALTV